MKLNITGILVLLVPLALAGQGNVRGNRKLSGIWAEHTSSPDKKDEIIAGEGILFSDLGRRAGSSSSMSSKSKKTGKKGGKKGMMGSSSSSSSEDVEAAEGVPFLDPDVEKELEKTGDENLGIPLDMPRLDNEDSSDEDMDNPVNMPPVDNEKPKEASGFTSPNTTAQSGCSLSVDIKCLPSEDGEEGTSCDDLGYEEVPECDVAPHELIFTFKGGICNKYMHPQDDARFMCQDFGQGPAMSKFETNYIEAMPPRKVGDIYFEGSVTVGDKFTIVDTEEEGSPIDEEILVLVYEDDSKVNLLQMMVFHTKCEDDLVLGDVYGSLALTAFANEAEGASLFKNVTYQVILKNTGTSPVLIQHAFNIADNNDMTDLWAERTAMPMLNVGAEESILEVLELDRSHPRTVSTSVTVSGYDESLNTCAAFDQLQIELPGPVVTYAPFSN